MICCNRQLAASMTRELSSSIRLIELERPPLTEYFITAIPADGRSVETLLGEVAKTLRDKNARIISQEVFRAGP